MRLLRPLEGLLGVLQRLFRKLVPGQVIFLPVVRGGCAVRVRGEFVEFGSSLVRVIWHEFLPLDFTAFYLTMILSWMEMAGPRKSR
jgi:hypothetical protein